MRLRNQGEVINLLYLKHQVQIFKLLPRALQARIFELLLRALQARIFKLLLRALQARIFEQLLAALRARIFALQMVLRVVMLLRGLEMPGEGAELLGLGNCLSHSWAKSTIVTQNVKVLETHAKCTDAPNAKHVVLKKTTWKFRCMVLAWTCHSMLIGSMHVAFNSMVVKKVKSNDMILASFVFVPPESKNLFTTEERA